MTQGDMTLRELVDRTVRSHGERAALVMPAPGGETRVTYAALAGLADRVAGGLAALGLSRGDAIGMWLPNVPEWVVIELAAATLGLLVVGLNTRFRAAELASILRVAPISGLVLPEGFLDIDFREILGKAIDAGAPPPAHVIVSGQGAPAAGLTGAVPYASLVRPAGPPVGAAGRSGAGRPGDIVNAFSTSGTTASPKLAVHTQAAVARHAVNVAAAFDVRAGDAMLCALPLCGVFGFNGAMAALAAGATCVLMPVFGGPEAAEAMATYGVTHVNGSDVMLRSILGVPGFDYRRLSRWRRAGFANFTGKPLELLREAEAKAGVKATGLYGSSECFALMSSWSPADPEERRALGGGVLVSGDIEVRAVEATTGEPLPHGAPGELQFRGYNVTGGYLANPEATARALTPDRWFRSGDLGHTLGGGAFVYASRLKDSLRLGGYLVDPVEIEEHLAGHEAVQVVQVVGVPVEGQGDVAVAFVRLEAGAACAADELIAFGRRRMAGYKVPREVVFLDRFPTTQSPNGEKIQKVRLREMAAEHLARAGGR